MCMCARCRSGSIVAQVRGHNHQRATESKEALGRQQIPGWSGLVGVELASDAADRICAKVIGGSGAMGEHVRGSSVMEVIASVL